MRKFIALGAAVVALAIAAASASAGNPNTLTLAVYGDSPYGTSNADTAEFAATPALAGSGRSSTDRPSTKGGRRHPCPRPPLLVRHRDDSERCGCRSYAPSNQPATGLDPPEPDGSGCWGEPYGGERRTCEELGVGTRSDFK